TICSSTMICRADLRCASLVAAALTLGAAAPAAGPVAEASAALARGDGIAAEVEAKRALDEGAPRGEVAALIGEAELLQGDLADARRWLADGEFSPATR